MFKNKDLVNLYLNQCTKTLDVRKCVGHFLRLLETSRLFRGILKKRRDLWEFLYENECFPWYLYPLFTKDRVMPIATELRIYALYFKPFPVEKIWSFLHARKIKYSLYNLIYKSFREDVSWNKINVTDYTSTIVGEHDNYVLINDIRIYQSGKIHYVNDESKSITLEDFYRPYLNLF
jgi:hypothetical protein